MFVNERRTKAAVYCAEQHTQENGALVNNDLIRILTNKLLVCIEIQRNWAQKF